LDNLGMKKSRIGGKQYLYYLWELGELPVYTIGGFCVSVSLRYDCPYVVRIRGSSYDKKDVWIHPLPQPTAAVGGNTVEAVGTTSRQVAVLSDISNSVKISLCAHFEGSDWPLNKALPRGGEFLCGPLEDIVRQYCLEKMQVAHQLLNYKKGKFLTMQVSILLNQSNLDKRIPEGMAMSAPKFVSSPLLRICAPEPSSFGSDFSNLCAMMNPLSSMACTYIRLLASSPDDACFCLLVGVVENWIQNMAERFPKTAAGVPNAQIFWEGKGVEDACLHC
jgi:hypothetical protein